MTRSRSKLILVPFTAAAASMALAATAYACTNFNGEFSVVGDASTQSVYSTGNDPLPPNFAMTQTIHGACCAKATHTTSGTVTVAAARDRNNINNKLPAATNYDINFHGGNAYTSHGVSWSLDCMTGSANVINLAHNQTVSSTGAMTSQIYNIPASQTANTGTNESAVCISDPLANYGNEVPVTLV